MSEEAAFIAAIRENPDDDTPRLAFADWLQDRGENDRAAFIRRQVATPGETLHDAPKQRNKANARHWEWFANPLAWADGYAVNRGFVSTLRCAAARWMGRADKTRTEHVVERCHWTEFTERDRLTLESFAKLAENRRSRPGAWGIERIPSEELAALVWPGTRFTIDQGTPADVEIETPEVVPLYRFAGVLNAVNSHRVGSWPPGSLMCSGVSGVTRPGTESLHGLIRVRFRFARTPAAPYAMIRRGHPVYIERDFRPLFEHPPRLSL